MFFWAEVEIDGRLVRVYAVHAGASPQVVLAGNVVQLPMYAVVDGQDLVIKVDDVDLVGSIAGQQWQLGRERPIVLVMEHLQHVIVELLNLDWKVARSYPNTRNPDVGR